jgi:hypothetical protein
MCTVAFLIPLGPKKGLGVGGDVSAGLACGDAEADAEVVLGMGEVGPGVKAFAFGFGLNDDAFAFNRLAVEVGEVGAASDDALPFVCGVGDLNLLPLKGGMG